MAETIVKGLSAGSDAMITQWDKFISMFVEDMSRNKCFFQVRISHIHVCPIYSLALVNLLKYQVLTAVIMKSSIFLDIMLCSPLKIN
jgi:hypothetical protein